MHGYGTLIVGLDLIEVCLELVQALQGSINLCLLLSRGHGIGQVCLGAEAVERKGR
jgi:hypothetical protein